MKTNNIFSRLTSVLMALASMVVVSCGVDGDGEEAGSYDFEADPSSEGYSLSSDKGSGIGSSGGNQGGNTEAGIVTAGEWSDLQNWAFWSGLMLSEDYADKSDYWTFYTNNRVAVQVVGKNGEPLTGVSVKLLRNGSAVWQTKTNNHGLANCWVGLFQKENVDEQKLTLDIDGQTMTGHPAVCHWDSLGQSLAVNRYVLESYSSVVKPQADIAFIVDATGSMGDEIRFLKSDLVDIIGKAQTVRPGMTMRTAALFYRDEGDEYLTRHSGFTTNLSETSAFVNKQDAEGGNDYPEALHSALEHMLQDLAWEPSARTRLAFLILDAPAHHETSVISSLQRSIMTCAEQGICLIPVSASGVDKNTEFMLRFFAICTGGTYTFLTNDSGVGFDHIKASVGDYEVEKLNDLLIRLINYYTEG